MPYAGSKPRKSDWPPKPGEIWEAADNWIPNTRHSVPISNGDSLLIIENQGRARGEYSEGEILVVLAPLGLRRITAMRHDIRPVRDTQ